MRKQTIACQRSGKEGRDSLQWTVGDVCIFLCTLIGRKFTFLGTLNGIKVHMSKRTDWYKQGEMSLKEGARVKTAQLLQSASRLQSNEIIHVLKLEDFVAPTHPTRL